MLWGRGLFIGSLATLQAICLSTVVPYRGGLYTLSTYLLISLPVPRWLHPFRVLWHLPKYSWLELAGICIECRHGVSPIPREQ